MGKHGYKVLFMTFSDGSRGFWLRYTYLWRGNESKAGVWATVFDDGPRGLHIRHEALRFSVGDVYEVSGPHAFFSTGRKEAFFEGDLFGWRLAFEGQPTLNTVPLLIRLFRRRSKYIMVHPHAIFNGEIKIQRQSLQCLWYAGNGWVHIFREVSSSLGMGSLLGI